MVCYWLHHLRSCAMSISGRGSGGAVSGGLGDGVAVDLSSSAGILSMACLLAIVLVCLFAVSPWCIVAVAGALRAARVHFGLRWCRQLSALTYAAIPMALLMAISPSTDPLRRQIASTGWFILAGLFPDDLLLFPAEGGHPADGGQPEDADREEGLFLYSPFTGKTGPSFLEAGDGQALWEDAALFPLLLGPVAAQSRARVQGKNVIGVFVPDAAAMGPWDANPEDTLKQLRDYLRDTVLVGKELHSFSIGKLATRPEEWSDVNYAFGNRPVYPFFASCKKAVDKQQHQPVDFDESLKGTVMFLQLVGRGASVNERSGPGAWMALTQSGEYAFFSGDKGDRGFIAEVTAAEKLKRARKATGTTPEKNKRKTKGTVADADKANVLRQAEEVLNWAAPTFEGFSGAAMQYCKTKDGDWWAGKKDPVVRDWKERFKLHTTIPVCPYDIGELDYETHVAKRGFPLLGWQEFIFENRFRGAPRERDLIFIEGIFSAGKTTFARMLGDPRFWRSRDMPNRSALNVTGIGKLDDFTMKYGSKNFPGVLLYDLPRHQQSFTDKMLNLLEHYTNTGSELEGVKYEGATVIMKSHIIVFSNSPSPPGILHKRVYHLQLVDKAAAANTYKWNMPGQQEDGSFNTQELERELREKARTDPMFRQAVQNIAADFVRA